FELMTIDHDTRKLIMANADSSQLRKSARDSGMRTLLESGKDKVSRGLTTIAEILRVTQEV
ncbi:General secretion pathway protein E, partial [Candidatus Magnetobacterium bavaricum]